MPAVRCPFCTVELGLEWRSSVIKRHRQIWIRILEKPDIPYSGTGEVNQFFLVQISPSSEFRQTQENIK
jgi:hypothetical protein